MIREWSKAGVTAKRGRPVNDDFEKQVIGQLVYTEIEKVDDVETAVVKANVAHSHAVIKRAAEIVKPWFKDDERVQKLTFTAPWVKGFLKRAALRRRRVTASEKVLPPVADVRKRMAEIQTVMDIGEYTDDEKINADETGVFFGAPPKNQLHPNQR
eukprot:2199147-Prymnesium_polylepis.1